MRVRQVRADDGTWLALRDVGTGCPVVLVHGWGMSSEVWDRQIGVLAQRGRRVLAVDLRGHGDSEAPLTGYDLPRLAQDLVAVLEQADPAGVPVPVVGWSIGGLVGLRLAHVRPDLVERLVLVSSQGVAGSWQAAFPFGTRAEVVEAALQAADRRDRVGHRRRTLLRQFAEPPSPEVADWLHRICLALPSWAGEAAMATLLHTDQLKEGDRLGVPVTQVVGTSDPALDLAGARWLHARWGTELVELDCGHFPMLERADAFDEALLAALGLAHTV